MRRTGGGLSAQAIDTKIDSLGASLGADVGVSSASFHATVIERSLEEFTELLISVLARPSFAAEELGLLRRESEGELIESRDNDRALVQRWFRRPLLKGHPYGRPLSGTVKTLPGFSVGDVRALYGQSWVAGNLQVAFAVDIERTASVSEASPPR